MRIRGTVKPECSLCRYFLNGKKSTCTLSNKDVTPKDACPEFKYDIFKYTPSEKNNFGKFSKEDFEI